MTDSAAGSAICVHGVVQGVGFRPFVYTTAAALGLSGTVRNDSSGAIIEVEGDRQRHRRVPRPTARRTRPRWR